MKLLLLGGATLLALAASEPAAHAQRVNFIYTGKLDTFKVPETGTYQIVAFGAQGGSGTFCAPTCVVGVGGRGAEIGGDFSLPAGETLQIAVGGAGMSAGIGPGGGGGGGGSFVVGPGNTPLVIAGGGGGGGGAAPDIPLPGPGGLTGPNGGSVDFSPPFRNGNGGTNGNGGGGGQGGCGGGGFFSAGGDANFPIFLAGGGGAFPGLAGGG